MILLILDLIATTKVRFSPNESHYKGSVFHGLIERALSDKSNDLWLALRGAPHRKARYALIPPQDSAPTYPAGHQLSVGVVLYGSAVTLWPDVLEAIMSCPRLSLGTAATPLILVSASLHHPDHPAQSHLHAVSARNPMPLCSAPVRIPQGTDVQNLSIELLSPTQINSQARRAATLPLTLSSIVKSLQQRLSDLEPTLAEGYGFESKEWQDDVRACWPHQIATERHIQAFAWVHQSRNTPGPMIKQAILGQMTFEGPVAASVLSLLDLGQWLALGQSCSLGQGWYALHTPHYKTLTPPPPLKPLLSPHLSSRSPAKEDS